MKVFISHSGPLSRSVANVLRDWLPTVLQVLEPWVSSEDIPKGSRWSQEVGSQLEDISAGIIVVVPGNCYEPWINFEAGALSKSVKGSLVSPFLFGIKVEELPATLSQFQATRYEREDVWKLIQGLNNILRSKELQQERLKKAFDLCWPELEHALAPLLQEKLTPSDALDKEPDRLIEDDTKHQNGSAPSQPIVFDDETTDAWGFEWEIVKRSKSYWRIAWKLIIANKTRSAADYEIKIKFEDAKGLTLDDQDVRTDYKISPAQQREHSEYYLMDQELARRLANATAYIKRN